MDAQTAISSRRRSPSRVSPRVRRAAAASASSPRARVLSHHHGIVNSARHFTPRQTRLLRSSTTAAAAAATTTTTTTTATSNAQATLDNRPENELTLPRAGSLPDVLPSAAVQHRKRRLQLRQGFRNNGNFLPSIGPHALKHRGHGIAERRRRKQWPFGRPPPPDKPLPTHQARHKPGNEHRRISTQHFLRNRTSVPLIAENKGSGDAENGGGDGPGVALNQVSQTFATKAARVKPSSRFVVQCPPHAGAERQTFNVGDRVDCRRPGSNAYLVGTIAYAYGDGTYDIAYEDRDLERRVWADVLLPHRADRRHREPVPDSGHLQEDTGYAFRGSLHSKDPAKTFVSEAEFSKLDKLSQSLGYNFTNLEEFLHVVRGDEFDETEAVAATQNRLVSPTSDKVSGSRPQSGSSPHRSLYVSQLTASTTTAPLTVDARPATSPQSRQRPLRHAKLRRSLDAARSFADLPLKAKLKEVAVRRGKLYDWSEVSDQEFSIAKKLCLAAKHGDADLIMRIVQGPSVSKTDILSSSHSVADSAAIASEKNHDVSAHADAVDVAIDLPVHGPFGATALLLAVQGGHMQAAHSLLSLSADVNACSKTGDTALHAAYSARDVAIARLLLDAGADTGLVNFEGKLPVHCGNAEFRERLRSAGDYFDDHLLHTPSL